MENRNFQRNFSETAGIFLFVRIYTKVLLDANTQFSITCLLHVKFQKSIFFSTKSEGETQDPKRASILLHKIIN